MAFGREIRAGGLVPAPPDEVFEFLADLENHWVLADRFIEVLSLERDPEGRGRGGRVRMRGPLGLRRTASTHVLAADPPHQMIGVAETGNATRAYVRWKLSAGEIGSRVRLGATIAQVGRLDRLLLLAGGGAWLERRFGTVLERLAQQFSHPRAAARGARSGAGSGLIHSLRDDAD